MNDNKRKLYDALSQDYDLGTFEQFESDIADAGKRRKLYDATIEEYDFGDFSEFENQLGFAPQAQIADTAKQAMQKPRGGENGYTFTAEELGMPENTYRSVSTSVAKSPEIKPLGVPRVSMGAEKLKPQGEAFDNLNKEKEMLEAQLDEVRRKASERRKAITSNAGAYQFGMAPVTGNVTSEVADIEMAKLGATENQLEQAIREVDRKISGEDAGFWQGVLDATVRNPGFYTMGMSDMSDARAMLDLSENGINSETDLALADATHENSALQEEADRGFMYRAGNMFGHSIPFMVQMAASGGGTGISKLGGKAVQRFAKETLKHKILRATGVMADDLLESAFIANTAGAGTTQTNILQRKAGQLRKDAQDAYYFEGKNGWLEAAAKGEMSSILEQYTEKLGNHLDGKLSITKGLDKIGAKRISTALVAAKNSDIGKAANTVLTQFGINGVLPEVMEEEANLVLNSIFVGDNKLSDLFDIQTQLDIVGGMFLTVGAMRAIPGTIGSVGYIRNQRKLNAADKEAEAVYGKKWAEMRERLNNASNEEVADVCNSMIGSGDDQALLDYYKSMMVMRGYNIGTTKREDNIPGAEQSYQEAYEQEPTAENAVKEANEYTNARNEVVKVLSLAEGADVDAMLEGRTAEEIAMGDTEVEDAVNNYIKARARRDGFRERYQEERDRQFAESDRSVDETANDGMVYITTTPSGEKIIITGGKVVLDNEGYIDVNQSEGLVAMFPDSQKKPVRPGDLREKVEVSNAEETKAARRASIEEQWRAEFESAENAYVEQQKRAEGVVFDVTDKEGTHRVEVVKEGDEMSNVLVDGEAKQISTEMLNALRGEAGVAPVVEGQKGENAVESSPTGEVAAPVVEAPNTALEQIPRNENNIPLYEQVDSELAWDGVVEEAGGNEETAMVAVNSMVEDKKKALAAAEKAKAKAGATITEKIAAENERVANIEKAKADLAKWEEIAGVKAKRAAAQAENVSVPVVEETQASVVESAPVEEVETPQATNEMQVADLTEDVKTEDVNQSENNLEMVAEGGNAPGKSGVVDNNNANALQNGNNELNLQKENESDNDQNQNDIPIGGQVPQSVPQGEYGTQAPLPGGVQETAARLRERIESAQGDSKSGLREVENRVTREFAQENSLWIENEFKLGVPFPSGDEHNNYIDAENQVVYKVNNRMHTQSILDLLDRIEQHNTYFPDSKYSLVGFTSVSENGDVMPVFAQDFVPDARMATVDEIDSYMGTLGFTRVGDGRYSNGEVVIKDLKPRNVLVDPNGDVYIVDAEFEEAKVAEGQSTPGQSGVQQNESGTHPVADKVLEMAKEKQQARFADHAKGIAEKLGVEVTVHNDESTVTNKEVMTAITEGGEVKGWYNPTTGEIALFLPAMESIGDVESTILHEAVSHYGIKHFLGKEDFNKFLDGVWEMMPAGTRAEFLQYVGADMKNPSKAKMRQAADEYVAHIAEKMDLNELEKSVWQRFIDYVMDVLRKAGFKNLKQRDVEAVIRASYANLRQNGGNSQVTGHGETMASKKMSERRQEKNRINNVLDEVGGIIYGNKEYAKKQRLKREAERKELAKEIYSSVLKGDFNDVTLSQIDKFIEDATPANPFGRRISQRLPQRMERALRAYERTNAVDALFSRISESAVPANERFSEAGRREIEERKKELLKGWAIATGNWHTDLKEFTDDTEPIGEGQDSKVYSAKEGPFVIKASKGKPYGKRFRPDIDNIALFNDVFRNSRYEILGYGEIDGEFVRILKQRAVDFSNSTPLAVEERVEYMRSLGFEPINKDNTAFSNGEIIIADLQKSNIVRDVEGDIRVIDADAKLHTKDVGGDYTYPPVETDLPEGTDLGDTMFRKVTPEMQESVMEGQTMFRKMNKHAEEFNKTHKGGVPVVDIDPNNIDAELAEEGFTAEEIQELKERIKKGGRAFYNLERNLIYLLDPSLSKENIHSLCWHEDTHVAISALALEPALMEEFYSFARGKKKDEFEAFLKKMGYEEEDYSEESLAYGIQAMDLLDNWNAELLSKLYGSTVEGAQRQMEIIQPLIDYINNGRQGTQGFVGENVQNGGMYDTTVQKISRKAETEGTGTTEATGRLTEEEIAMLEASTGYSRDEIIEIFGDDLARQDQIFLEKNLGVSANEEVTSGKKIIYDEAKKESAGKSAVKNNANFVSTYKTKDGKDIKYTSERAEGYGIQGGGTGNSYDGTGNSILQRQTDTGVPGGNSGLNTEKGEFCVVERVFTENGAFNFTSGEKIESADDVAYIFSALEDAAKEHSFVVYVKDGKPTVVELGMGRFNATMVDIPTASLAYSRINPDHVYFVHNHPSGNLICSDLDVKMLREFEGISDVPVTGVIINLKTGKYGTFDTERHSAIGEKRVPENEERLTVHTLDKQIFAPDYDPMAQPLVRSSQDVAQFLNSQRMGDRPKVSFLILSRANRIIGNIHTPFTDITTDTEAVARYINERVIQFGGENAILYGDFAISMDESRGFRLLQGAMGRFGNTKLLDVVHVEGNFTKSANDHGFLYEPEADYGVVKESEQGYGSTEQKKKQEALKENAKAIRRLHNVKANYPITALRNLGFALETQEQREMHDRLFAERDAMSGRENAVSIEVNPQGMTLQERITESLLKMTEQNKDNVELRLSAIRAYGRDLANVIKLMRVQRGYDRNTVNMFVSLAKMYLRNNAMSGMSSYDISRLLGLISRANGGYGPQVMRAAEQIAEIITKSHTRELEDIVRKQIKTGAEKVNASGVVVQGGVDVVGKRVLNTFRDAINMTSEEEFEKAFREAFERAAKFPNDVEVKAACDAMVIAKEYRDNIIEAKKQESELLKSINQYSKIRSRYDRGEITRREYNEFVDAVRKSLIELRSRMVDDYQRIIHALGGDISEGIKRAKEFRERELARVEKIHNMAEADMSGVSKSAERKKRGFWRKATDYVAFKNPLAKVTAEGLGTYNEFMKFFGRNAIGGKGRLHDYFIGRYTEVQNQEWVEKQKDIKKIDERCEMVFGKGFKDVMHDSEKNSGVVLEYWDGGERVSRDLSIGQLMYIYMTAKQTDGEMKLRGMGITEETVNKAVAVLPARYKVFADWVQSDFLPEMRPRLNEVHKRMFGASMSEVKNYFPLVVNTDARQAEVDLNSVMPITPSTITGSIIKRKVNATPLNLESNAFDVLLNHVSDMEHWAAFAEFTRDNNTLIGDKDFMNRVKNSRDLRFGDGEAIWNNFVETARITTGNYRAKKDEWANVMKGVSSAKITFGYYTALKQILSSPAMWLEASTASIIKATVNPLGSWRWAIENLPGFEERWKGRTAGNERLADSDSDWSIWDNRVVKAARKVGMTPNAFVDAVVVSTGARAVYDSRKRFYKALGLSQEEQHKRALKDAAVAYNETQQSAQGVYLSILQKEGGFKAVVMTLYRNSQMAYSRKVTGSMAELYKKAVRWKDIIDAEEEKYLEMGLSEEDAKKEANKALLKSVGKDVATLVMFGYVLNMVWYLGEQLPYLLFGDDEEEKEKIMDTALKIGATGMFEGFALGNVAKDLYVKGVTGNRYSLDMLTTPFASDAEKIYNRFANDGTLAGMSQLLILGAETATGISPQRLIDDVAAVIDICNGDLDKATEVTLLTTRLAKVPQSQIDKLYLEEALGGDVVALAERYAEYKRLRDYPLNIADDKILKKYAERFKKAHNEDLKEIVRDENAYEGYFSNASPEEKIKLAGYRGEYLEELTGKKAEEVLAGRELVYYTLYGRKEQNLVYSAMTTPDDVDDEICIEMMMSELKPIYEGLKKAEDRTAYANEHQKELGLYKRLDKIEQGVGNYKSAMKKIGEEYPNYAHDFMTIIRTLRAEAVELINKYRNE